MVRFRRGDHAARRAVRRAPRSSEQQYRAARRHAPPWLRRRRAADGLRGAGSFRRRGAADTARLAELTGRAGRRAEDIRLPIDIPLAGSGDSSPGQAVYIKIGRSRQNDVVLRRDPEVSKGHCRIWMDEHGDVYAQAGPAYRPRRRALRAEDF